MHLLQVGYSRREKLIDDDRLFDWFRSLSNACRSIFEPEFRM